MKLLVDNALSPRVAERLRAAGHDALHLREIARADATDDLVFALAEGEGRVIVSADTDFGTLLAQRVASTPSVVLVRRLASRRPDDQAVLILRVLALVADDLAAGAVVVVDDERLRVRRLPIQPR